MAKMVDYQELSIYYLPCLSEIRPYGGVAQLVRAVES